MHENLLQLVEINEKLIINTNLVNITEIMIETTGTCSESYQEHCKFT